LFRVTFQQVIAANQAPGKARNRTHLAQNVQ
jgi:hypothetical protein